MSTYEAELAEAQRIIASSQPWTVTTYNTNHQSK